MSPENILTCLVASAATSPLIHPTPQMHPHGLSGVLQELIGPLLQVAIDNGGFWWLVFIFFIVMVIGITVSYHQKTEATTPQPPPNTPPSVPTPALIPWSGMIGAGIFCFLSLLMSPRFCCHTIKHGIWPFNSTETIIDWGDVFLLTIIVSSVGFGIGQTVTWIAK